MNNIFKPALFHQHQPPADGLQLLLHFLPGRIDICAGAAFGFQTEFNAGKADAAIILQAAFAGQAVAAYAGVVRFDGFHNRRDMRFGKSNNQMARWARGVW